MDIRLSKMSDFVQIMAIIFKAREFMIDSGNPTQWGNSRPSESQIIDDIKNEKSYVCVNEDRIVGTFYFDMGKSIEPTYSYIEEGSWMSDDPYGVIHRLASDGTYKGLGTYVIKYCMSIIGHLRVDTHKDNIVMQRILENLGFSRRGIIYVDDGTPRIAYEILD